MTDYAYYNGIFTPYDAACIPLSDRSIFFGDAVYDVVIGMGKTAYQLDEHLDRLFKNAEAIGLGDIPNKLNIKSAISDIIELSCIERFILYIQFSANDSRRSHIRQSCDVNTLITITEFTPPHELEFTSAVTLPDKRHGMCNVKATNLLPAVLATIDASNVGTDTAILHKDGIITECTNANVSILKDGCLITHPLDSYILPGISQKNLIRIAIEMGVSHVEKAFDIQELIDADLVMVTSTTKLLKVCESIDGISTERKGIKLGQLFFDSMRRDLFNKTYGID